MKDLEDDKQSQNSFFLLLEVKNATLSQLESAASVWVVFFHLLYPATHSYQL